MYHITGSEFFRDITPVLQELRGRKQKRDNNQNKQKLTDNESIILAMPQEEQTDSKWLQTTRGQGMSTNH